MIKRCGVYVMSLLLVGCVFNDPVPGDKAFAPTYPVEVEKGKGSNDGAIYHPGTSIVLFETPRARRVGDILTILLVEKTTAQKKAQNTSTKDNTATITNPTVLGNPVNVGVGGERYNLGFSNVGTRDFSAETESKQNNQLSGSISVTVNKVLSNGNMIVQGEKWVKINTGKEYVQLSGIVRPQDVTPDNTVTSDRVANARIAYSGTGQNHEEQNMGWLSKFLWSSLFPF